MLRAEDKLAIAGCDAVAEAHRAIAMWLPFNSAREGYEAIREEFYELRRHVFANQKKRSQAEMRKEAVQLAALALRFITDVCDTGGGGKSKRVAPRSRDSIA